MSSRLPPQLLLRGIAVSAAALAVIGALVAPEFLNPRELQAAPVQRPMDPDGDGLVNAQETVLGTNRFAADTDGDNFSDLEELARKTSPRFPQSIPQGHRLAVGMSAHGSGQDVRALIAFYLPDGKLRNKLFKAGVLVGNRTIVLSQEYLMQHTEISLHPARDPNARIAVLELPISSRMVRYFGNMSVFATIGNASEGYVQAADSIHLVAIGPMIVLQMSDPRILGTGSLGGGGGGGGGGSGDVGSIYVPLGGGEPGNWTAGQVCVQQTNVIGASGAMVTVQVISAECEDGWDGYCPANCTATVGNTYTTIDPVALIGG